MRSAQRAFLMAEHPGVARRWMRMAGKGSRSMRGANPVSSSEEVVSPFKDKAPRVPGGRRDFGRLSPNASARFKPVGSPRPNEEEAMREPRGVQFMPGSRHTELGKPQAHAGNRGRDARVALKMGRKD
jgi:hypothetical protein